MDTLCESNIKFLLKNKFCQKICIDIVADDEARHAINSSQQTVEQIAVIQELVLPEVSNEMKKKRKNERKIIRSSPVFPRKETLEKEK